MIAFVKQGRRGSLADARCLRRQRRQHHTSNNPAASAMGGYLTPLPRRNGVTERGPQNSLGSACSDVMI